MVCRYGASCASLWAIALPAHTRCKTTHLGHNSVQGVLHVLAYVGVIVLIHGEGCRRVLHCHASGARASTISQNGTPTMQRAYAQKKCARPTSNSRICGTARSTSSVTKWHPRAWMRGGVSAAAGRPRCCQAHLCSQPNRGLKPGRHGYMLENGQKFACSMYSNRGVHFICSSSNHRQARLRATASLPSTPSRAGTHSTLLLLLLSLLLLRPRLMLCCRTRQRKRSAHEHCNG